MSRRSLEFDLLALRRGRRGGVIVPHRGLRALQWSRANLLAAVALALGLTAVWLFLFNPTMRLWSIGLQALLHESAAGGSVQTIAHSVGRWHLDTVRVDLAPHAMTHHLWWIGNVACLVMLAASFVISRRFLPLIYLLRLVVLLQGSAQIFFWRAASAFPYDVGGYTEVLLTAGAFVIGLAPLLFGFTLFPLDLPWHRKLNVTLLAMGHLVVFVPLQYFAHALLLQYTSLLAMPLLFWMFGLPLDILVLVALFSWAASWSGAAEREQRMPTTVRRARVRQMAGLALAACALTAPQARAQLAPRQSSLEVDTDFGHYDHDLGTAQSQGFRFRTGRPWHDEWLLEVGHAARFNDDGFGVGAMFRRHVRRDTRVMLGASTGTGDVIFPDWRVDLGLDHGLLPGDRLLASVGYTHIKSKDVNSVDGFSGGLVLYGAPGWIASAFYRVDVGQPGSTTSRSGGLGLIWQNYRRWSVDAGYEQGDVSYLLVAPGSALVGFHSQTFRAGASRYLGERWGLAGRLQRVDTDFYTMWSVGARVFVEW